MIWPNNSPLPTHVDLGAILSPEDVKETVTFGQMTIAAQQASGDYSGRTADGSVRARPQGDTSRVARRIWDVVKSTNAEYFRFDVIGIEHWLYREYPAGSYASNHMDRSYGYKLSVSIQLSAPEEYDGGDLRLLGGTSSAVMADRTLGHGIVFPSYVLHEVTPITRGVRKALVVWCIGPEFR